MNMTVPPIATMSNNEKIYIYTIALLTIILVSVYFCCKNTLLLFYFEFSTMKN